MSVATTAFTVALTLKAFDEMSKVVGQATNTAIGHFTRLQDKIKQTGQAMDSWGQDWLRRGLYGVGALAKPIEMFADLEDAGTRLRMTLMKSSGAVSEHFEQIDALAIRLGNQLPGTTADFQNMFSKLIQLGITEESLLSGVGESAAYLGVVLKRPYEETAEVAAKLKEATGTADADMLRFIDTIQRTAHLGVDLREMEYAFSRFAGALKLAGYQGLETSKSLAALFAMLIKAGISGERAGTNFAALMTTLSDRSKLEKANEIAEQFGVTLRFLNAQGRLVGPEELIRQLERLNALPPPARMDVLKALFGPGMDMQEAAILMQQGVAGYREMVARMEAQADLQQRTAAVLGTLRNLWEAATGTFTNTLAAWVETFSPELKRLTDWFNALSEWLVTVIKQWPTVARWTGLAAVGFTGLALALATVGLGVGLALSATAKIMDGLGKVAHAAQTAGRWALWGGQQAIRGFIWMGRAALGAGRQALTGLDLAAAGAKLVESLWLGIRSAADQPVQAMKDLVTKLRALLPFSPAKEGPLRDLHRIRLIETIAETVRPAPLLSAMQRTAAAVAVTAPLTVTPTFAGGAGVPGPRVLDSREVLRSASSVLRTERPLGAPITIHYAPTITLGPGAAAAGAGAIREDLRSQLRADADELARLIEEAQRRRARGSY